jgi:hypothetical protein
MDTGREITAPGAAVGNKKQRNIDDLVRMLALFYNHW